MQILAERLAHVQNRLGRLGHHVLADAGKREEQVLGAETLRGEERSEWLEQGLAMLPVEQRATLQLAYFVGYSCEEIAAIMDCPVNTVKARMFQARIKLRNLLPKLGGFADANQLGGSQL